MARLSALAAPSMHNLKIQGPDRTTCPILSASLYHGNQHNSAVHHSSERPWNFETGVGLVFEALRVAERKGRVTSGRCIANATDERAPFMDLVDVSNTRLMLT